MRPRVGGEGALDSEMVAVTCPTPGGHGVSGRRLRSALGDVGSGLSLRGQWAVTAGNSGTVSVFSPRTLLQDCLDRSFRAQVFSCPACRYDLGRSYAMQVNQPLQAALNQLFPGYGNGR